VNDGGQQYTKHLRPNVSPRSLREIREFTRNGRTLAAYPGRNQMMPESAFLKSDLTAAYGDKLRNYSRSFIFLRNDRPEQPGAVIVYDRLRKKKPESASTFALNTLAPARFDGVRTLTVTGVRAELRGDFLLPAAENLRLLQLRGADLLTIHGHQFRNDRPGSPQEQGTRNLFTIQTPSDEDEFLVVLQPSETPDVPLPPMFRQHETHFEILVGKRLTILSRAYETASGQFAVTIDPGVEGVLLAGFESGKWRCANVEFDIRPGEHAIYLQLPAGQHKLERIL